MSSESAATNVQEIGVPQPDGPNEVVQPMEVQQQDVPGDAPMDDTAFVSAIVLRSRNPIRNEEPLVTEVLYEPSWPVHFPDNMADVVHHESDRMHVRTSSNGSNVLDGEVRFHDAASNMAFPSTVLGPCVVRGFGGGKIMLSRMMDRPVPPGDHRSTYVVSTYLS